MLFRRITMSKNLQMSPVEERDSLPLNLAMKNRLLAELLTAAEAKDYFGPRLKIVTLDRNQVLYEQGDTIDYVYFPIDSVVSSLAIMEDGTTVETLMVGNDGLAGISAI